MFKRNKIILLITVLFFILGILVFCAFHQAKILHRDPAVLINRYYLLQHSNPEAARKALLIILHQDENNILALRELSDIYIKEKNFIKALPLVKKLHELNPADTYYTIELASLYYDIGKWDNAYVLLTHLKNNENPLVKQQAQVLLDNMSSSLLYYNIDAIRVNKAIFAEDTHSQVVTILLNLFYKLQKSEPIQAKQLLVLLHMLSANDVLVSEEMAYAALEQGDHPQALSYLLFAYQQNPSSQLALQLAYLYTDQGNRLEASQYFLVAAASHDPALHAAALKGYRFAQGEEQAALQNKVIAPRGAASQESLLLDQFYLLKQKDKPGAWLLIKQIILQYPDNVSALKEGGFLAITQGSRIDAIHYFTQAYNLNSQPDLAMQLGYLYDQTDNKYLAYHYFNLATQSADKTLALRAQNALTNLSGLEMKRLPSPYFSELFFDPFSQSRFGLTVRPFIARLGVEFDNRFQTKTYFVFRQTQDNKTTNLGQISQIYEDNVRIMGVGAQINPLKSIPLVAFVEAGEAYDLVYRNRNRWRGDLRGGLMYYNEFGTKPAYFDHLKISKDYYSLLYGDITYFSRYDNNVIGTLKTHQGIRLLQYHSSMLNLYGSGRVLEDTRREFFNNFAEIGPGIGFIPSNRFKVELHFEHVRGVYLPAGGSTNPYGKYYTNNTVQLFMYTKF
jgi:tetratricopeptide (TPR) repeat protein